MQPQERIVLGKLSGRHAFAVRLRELGYLLEGQDLDDSFARFKDLAEKKKQISDANLDSIIRYIDYAKHPRDAGGWAIGHIGPVPEGLVAWFIAALAIVAACVAIGERNKS